MLPRRRVAEKFDRARKLAFVPTICTLHAARMSTRTIPNCAGWMLAAEIPQAVDSRFILSPGWRDTAELVDVTHDGKASSTLSFEGDKDAEVITLAPEGGSCPSVIEVKTPQLMDVHADVGAAHITVTGKLEGNCLLATDGGRVEAASTIRGMTINIDAGEGPVAVRKVLEAGTMSITCGKLHAKRLMGETIRIVAGPASEEAQGAQRRDRPGAGGGGGLPGDSNGSTGAQGSMSYPEAKLSPWSIHVESSYCANASYIALGPGGSVTVDGHHGHVQAKASDGEVQVKGVTGSAEVSAAKGSATAQFDSLRGASTLIARGDVHISLVPPVHATLHLMAPGGVILKPGLTGVFRTDEKANAQASEGGMFDVRGTLVVKSAAPTFGGAHGNVPMPRSFAAGGVGGVGGVEGVEQEGAGHSLGAGTSPKTSGGSGKIREDIPISGFYSNASPSAGAGGNAGSSSTGGPGQVQSGGVRGAGAGQEADSMGYGSQPVVPGPTARGDGQSPMITPPTPSPSGPLPTLTATSTEGCIVVEVVSWYDSMRRKVEGAA